MSYNYGKMGERTGITYPDGKTVAYRYDEQLRLIKMQIPDGGITYRYDENGRLSEKRFPDGMRTLWHYGANGELTELIHEDKDGILDKYGYEYDLMGNKTAITKERRGLEKESGRYEYGYDALSRLATVTKDREALRSYAYDPFGNRSVMEDHKAGRKTAYAYDALDRLHTKKEVAGGKESIREYLYDNRGNLTEEREDGKLLHGYAYNALNRLERAWNADGAEAAYEYNGLGQWTAKQTGEGREEYLLDLTKPYHNLLGMVKGEDARSFYWDGNIAAMSEKDELHYYLQDELGSSVRVSGYDKDYLTYGYDEFGNDLYHDMEEAGIPNPYSRQGEEQPFGYTGYRYDNISGTYFAQAREYQPENGRFTAEDVIKGNGAFPETLNRYGYCWGNPVGLVDNNGKFPLSNTSVMRVLVDPCPISRAIPTYVGTYDEKGQELINRYLYGDGSPYVIDNDESWSDYMMSNEALTVWTGRYLAPIGQNLEKGESIEVDMQISMRVENSNYKTGYMLIYGSNANVGGYQIQGTVSKGLDNTIVYDLDYTFNDKMDENFRYLDDRIKYAGARTLQFLSNDITLNVYDLQVSWTDTTIIYADGRANEGWLANMEVVNFDSEYDDLDDRIELAENFWWLKRDIPGLQLSKKTFEQMQNYMRSHPEYYGCFAE